MAIPENPTNPFILKLTLDNAMANTINTASAAIANVGFLPGIAALVLSLNIAWMAFKTPRRQYAFARGFMALILIVVGGSACAVSYLILSDQCQTSNGGKLDHICLLRANTESFLVSFAMVCLPSILAILDVRIRCCRGQRPAVALREDWDYEGRSLEQETVESCEDVLFASLEH